MDFEKSQNILTTAVPVFTYGNLFDTLTVDPGVLLATADSVAIFSNKIGNSLFNSGNIVSVDTNDVEDDPAVEFLAGGAVVVNQAGAHIVGSYDGLSCLGGTASVTNVGDIEGLRDDGIKLLSLVGHNMLTNSGSVFGQDAAVEVTASDQVNNRGELLSTHTGIVVSALLAGTAVIVNAAQGIIEGATHGIIAIGGMSFTNAGEVIGGVDCSTSTQDELIVNHGKILGSVVLGHGNDVFKGTGGTSGAIFGGSGHDLIVAGKGGVQMHVGTGNNTLSGGPGADHFIFDSGLGGQVERITNFKHGADKIVLSAADFAGIGPIGHKLAAADFHVGASAHTPSQHIIYNANNGFLYYDPDGKGPAAQVHFATLAAHLSLSHADFLVEA